MRAILPALLLALLVGCGGTMPQTAPAPGEEAERVIRAWAERLRDGDVQGASRLWAVPARAANGTPPLELRTARAVLAFNAAFPCGAEVIATRPGRDRFMVVSFRITSRKGADCAGGEGSRAGAAIRVRDGRITDWLRLPDGGVPPGDDPTSPPGGRVI